MTAAAVRTITPARFPRWASVREAEAYSGVPAKTLRGWIARGVLPATRLGPRLIQIDLNEIDRLRTPVTVAAGTSPQLGDEQPARAEVASGDLAVNER